MSVEDDFSVAVTDLKGKVSSFEDMLKAIELFFSDENIDQTSRLTGVSKQAMIVGEVFNEFLSWSCDIQDDIYDRAIKEELSKSVSLNGLGRREFVEILRGLDLEENEKSQANNLFRLP